MKTFLIFAAAALTASAATAADLKVETPWARASAPLARTGAAYLTLTNSGRTADRLIGGSTPVAEAFELHETSMAGGVMRMRALPDGVAVLPGQPVRFAPGGMHIMLMGLKQPLKAGDTFPATLRFERAGAVKVTFKVEPAGSAGPATH
jgi:hypothetical protein